MFATFTVHINLLTPTILNRYKLNVLSLILYGSETWKKIQSAKVASGGLREKLLERHPLNLIGTEGNMTLIRECYDTDSYRLYIMEMWIYKRTYTVLLYIHISMMIYNPFFCISTSP